MSPRSKATMTTAEYLTWEREQTERHEFLAGEVFLQASGTRIHSLISGNILRAIGNHLTGQDCEAHGSDMRIHVEATGLYAYPDVSVVCPPFEGESHDVLNNPALLVEVLSPSTADYDRGGKFGHYRQFPPLKNTSLSGRAKLVLSNISVRMKVCGYCERYPESTRSSNCLVLAWN